MNSLKQEKVSLEDSIKETRGKVSREIVKIIPLAQDTISRLGEDLRRGNEEALAEIRSLKDEAVEVGKEIGRYEGILKANAWLDDLPALIRGEKGTAKSFFGGKILNTRPILSENCFKKWLRLTSNWSRV